MLRRPCGCCQSHRSKEWSCSHGGRRTLFLSDAYHLVLGGSRAALHRCGTCHTEARSLSASTVVYLLLRTSTIPTVACPEQNSSASVYTTPSLCGLGALFLIAEDVEHIILDVRSRTLPFGNCYTPRSTAARCSHIICSSCRGHSPSRPPRVYSNIPQ